MAKNITAKKLVLHQYPAIPGALSASPFCMKVHYALRRKGLEYETKNTLFADRVSPQGKLPALAIDAELVVDSTDILRRLDDELPTATPLYPADPERRAVVDVLEDWADDTLYWYAIHYRWVREHNFAKLAGPFFASLPAALRPFAPAVGRRKIVAQAKAQGIGRRRSSHVDIDFERQMLTLDRLLTNRHFLTGEELTAADIAVASQLMELRIGVSQDAEAIIAAHPVSCAWLDRTTAACA